MCGIFGVIAKENDFDKHLLLDIVEKLAIYSQVRGKDSSGLAYRFEDKSKIEVLKGPVSVDKLLKTKEYKELKRSILNQKSSGNGNFAMIGHARLVTNGSQLEDVNNQPVIKDGIVGIHNGIIVNVDELWNKHHDIKREYVIDTEVVFSLFRKYLIESNDSIYSIKKTNDELFGTISTGFFINDRDEILTYTNNGSLYILTNHKNIFIYASEKFILNKLKEKFKSVFTDDFTFKQVPSNSGYILEYKNFKIEYFDLSRSIEISPQSNQINDFKISIKDYHPKKKQLNAVVDPDKFTKNTKTSSDKDLLEYNIDRISKLKRCSKCLLPETFPFIEFDEQGVCNICNNYKVKDYSQSLEELQRIVEPYRKNNEQPDCLVPFSGGRDSTYVLHFVKNVLKLNPIAFTYDWGMVTDLARRNIARVCGKLGVENIIVAANIHKKRKYIRENISAWLKKPALGMIPLFMAGDKYFFKYAHEVRKQNDIKLQIWGINHLENTEFKVGFAGVPPEWNKEMIYSMNVSRQMKLFTFVFKNIVSNLSYINSSVPDTIGSFLSRYSLPKDDYYHFFDYYEWNEQEIEGILFNDYDWERAKDLDSTWRIGDGTASFYNYIYYTVAGFSEFDTFRSNQIREGMLSRKEALDLINKENIPRYESLKWYLEIIGLDFESVIKVINNIPKLY